MKKMRQASFISFLAVITLVFTACSSKKLSQAVETEELLTFEELIQKSDVAVVGEYVETIKNDNYIEQKFNVKECLYGDVTDNEIYLYSSIGTGYVAEIDYTYEIGADIYEAGMDYILIMEKAQSIMYDHDRYMLNADIFLCDSHGEYSLYSQPLDIPAEIKLKDYIGSIYSSVPRPAISTAVPYKDEADEMLGESEYVGTVKILELVNEGKVHNGNTYRCFVESLSKGSNLNTYDDGTILIVILKNTVEISKDYIVGFSPVDEGSLIYMQSTDTSVYNVNDEQILEICRKLLTGEEI